MFYPRHFSARVKTYKVVFMDTYKFIFDIAVKFFSMPGVLVFIAGVALCMLEMLEHKIFRG